MSAPEEPANPTLLLHRCAWAGSDLLVAYHDHEWGVPVHDACLLFEFMTLEGAQAGLSWEIVLKKRENYRRLFAGFEPAKVAAYSEEDVGRLLSNSGIIRNRLKVRSAISNARAFREVQREFGSFDAYLWRFVQGAPLGSRQSARERVTRTNVSDHLSKDLGLRGFKFVGTTICYALMQAIGMVNDHDFACFRRREVALLR